MSPVISSGIYSYYGVAADESVDPAVLVIVGDAGIILYSTGTEEDAEGFESYTFVQAPRFTYSRVNGVDFGEGIFIAVCDAGLVAISPGGSTWTKSTSGNLANLMDVCYVGSSVWVAVGAGGVVLRSDDNGASWSSIASGAANQLNAVAAEGNVVVAVGDSGEVVISSDAGATFDAVSSGSVESLRGVVWCGDLSSWVIVGHGSSVMLYDGNVPGLFDPGVCDVEVDLEGVAWAGAGGLLIASGSGSVTVTSTNGIAWAGQESGATSPILYAVEYLASKFVAVGSAEKIAYSATGAGIRAFDKFKPVSDIYRAVAFARFGGTMLYAGLYELFEGDWVYFPRRIRSPAPGTVDDFDEAFGAYLSDLPGDGAILSAASIEGGVVLGEQNQISLLTDGGSLLTPWAYHDNYGEGLQVISNWATFGGAGYAICTDGLIYRADYNQVARLDSFFDLTKFDDFNPGSERVSIQFDPATQKLVIFRPASPWVIFLCDDDTGGVTEFHLPEFTDGGITYTPQAVVVAQGEISGIKVAYGSDHAPMQYLVTLDLQLSSGIIGFDIIDGAEERPFAGEIVTGCFRMTQLGRRGEVREILLRTTCDVAATVRPRIAIGVKSEPEDDWRYSPPIAGQFAVDGSSGTIYGVGTALSNKIEAADGVTTDYEVPWLVEKLTQVYTKHTGTGVKTPAAYTKIGAREIRLAAVIPANEELFVHAKGLPYVRGEVGDLVELTNGELHLVDGIVNATEATCGTLPAGYHDEAVYIPTQEMPAGDSYGSGKLVFGLGQGFDQLMLRFIMVAGINGDAKYAKINSIEIGYEPTGPELKTDGE